MVLTIETVRQKDFGTYACVVRNSLGEVRRTVQLQEMRIELSPTVATLAPRSGEKEERGRGGRRRQKERRERKEKNRARSNWGQEGAGIKENEIQIVTLEKQKDTYQDFGRATEATLTSNISPRSTECSPTLNRMCRWSGGLDLHVQPHLLLLPLLTTLSLTFQSCQM